MERVNRALLLTDLVDSTRLVESLGSERAAETWAAHDSAARALLATHRGREIDKTDGFLLIFEDCADAAAHALDYHALLERLSDELGAQLAARAGLHFDEVLLRANPESEIALGAKPREVEGLAKPLAARGNCLLVLDNFEQVTEHAGARINRFSPAQLVERMSDRFRLLAGARGVSGRQATLRAAIDRSWDLLAPWERAAFAQCSVFAGGFTLEAAESVLDLSAFPDAPWAPDAVQSLVEKTLLRSWSPTAAGERQAIDEPWFGMYVSLQDYAAEKLRSRDAIAEGLGGVETEAAAFLRHGEFFARLGGEEALRSLNLTGGLELRRSIALDLDNVVTACRRALARAALDAGEAMARDCGARPGSEVVLRLARLRRMLDSGARSWA